MSKLPVRLTVKGLKGMNKKIRRIRRGVKNIEGRLAALAATLRAVARKNRGGRL